MRTQEITLYNFDELDETAKQKARQWYIDGALDYDWHEFVYEDAGTVAGLMGITIDNIYFSGFSSQGDGACFEGSYEYAKGSAQAVKGHAPVDTELHRIVEGLRDVQKRNFYQLTAAVKHRGHYYHELCTEVSVYSSYEYGDVSADTEETVTELLRDLMCWIYKQLESEYDYMNSDEQVEESIRANEYEFIESGDRA